MRKEEISKTYKWKIDVGKYLGLGRKIEVSDQEQLITAGSYFSILNLSKLVNQILYQLFIIDLIPHYNTLVSNTEVPHISGEDIPIDDVRKIFILY